MGRNIRYWFQGAFIVTMCISGFVILRLTSLVKQQKQVITLQEAMLNSKDELLQAQQMYMNIKAQADSTRNGQDSRFFRAYFVQDQLRWLRDYEKYIAGRTRRSSTIRQVGIGGGN